MSAESQLLEMIQSGQAFAPDQLMPLYDQLAPASLEFMLGTWKGGKFDGGKEPDPIKWYGKRFVSATHAEPLLCYAPDGSVYSYENLGLAQMREVLFRGQVCAALIYDKQPIMDYFRKVNDQVVIGLGDVKGKPTDFFFHLTRA
ncbi:MAG: DUF4334 domain-containing protein [Burkholderiales bacterium]|nr:DUF4334 domain-containing protein [Burkholderiales bacterium]